MKCKTTLFSFFLIIISQFQAFSQPDAYLLGIAAMNQKDYTSAIQRFTEGLQNETLKTQCLLYRGRIYYLQGEYDNAIKDFLEAEKSKPAIASYDLAKCYARQGNIENTIYYLRNHLESPYKLPESVIKVEDAFSGFEKYKDWKALWQNEWYNKSEKTSADASYMVNSGDNVDAVDFVNKSLLHNPKSYDLYVARARAFNALGNKRSALDDYSTAISLNKRNAIFYAERGAVYTDLGKDRKAIDDYTKALKLKPELFDLYLKRAEAYKRSEDYSHALKDIEMYKAFFPESEEAAFDAGQVYYELNKFDDALSEFNPLIKKDPSKPEYFHARGLTYFEMRNLDAAIQDFGQALDLNPDLPETWYNKGLARFYKGDQEGACADWKKARDLGHQGASEYIGMYCK